MCGLVGIAGKLEFKDEGTLKRLLILDYFRGTDSTGVAAIRKDGHHAIAKIASHPIDLFDTKAYEKVNHGYQSLAFIGHNRAATRGKVNGLNAHPYQYGHIIGAHNGTLELSSWKALNEALGYETDVDSMAIFACIEKFGIQETVKMLQGAWALVWFDTKEGTLNFLKNKERPLWFAYDDDFKRVFWASEWPMIQAAVEMAPESQSLSLFSNKDGYSYFPVRDNYLHTYDLEKLSTGMYTSFPDDICTEKLEGKAPAPVVSNPYKGSSPFQAKTGGTTTSLGSDQKSKTPPYITMISSANKPFANFLSQEEFNRMSGGKCCYCLEPIEFLDDGLVVFEGMNEILCGECSGHSTSRYMATPKTYTEHLKVKKEMQK